MQKPQGTKACGKTRRDNRYETADRIEPRFAQSHKFAQACGGRALSLEGVDHCLDPTLDAPSPGIRPQQVVPDVANDPGKQGEYPRNGSEPDSPLFGRERWIGQ